METGIGKFRQLVYVNEILSRDEDKNGDGDTLDGGDESLYYVQDANWNVVTLCGEDGEPVERYLYDPYGLPSFFDGSWSTRGGSAYGNAVLFTGRLWHPGTYTYDYRHREESPYLGRFLQRDPLGAWGDFVNGRDAYGFAQAPVEVGGESACYCGPDVTTWFVDELNTHRKFVSLMHDNMSPGFGGKVALLVKFRIYAGRIPYKWCTFTTRNCPRCSKCADTVALCGTCISKTELGGIMFGAMARLSGIAITFAIGAPVFMGITTTEADMAGNLSGVEIGKNLHEDLDAERFCKLLNAPTGTDELEQLKNAFDKDSNTRKLLAPMTTSLVRHMAVEGCTKCPDAAPVLGHSDFTHQSDRFDRDTYEYEQVYRALSPKWPRDPFSAR